VAYACGLGAFGLSDGLITAKEKPQEGRVVAIGKGKTLDDGKVKIGELPINYWLLPPNAPTYEENYRRHCSL
jgi:hypothetical protein